VRLRSPCAALGHRHAMALARNQARHRGRDMAGAEEADFQGVRHVGRSFLGGGVAFGGSLARPSPSLALQNLASQIVVARAPGR